MNKRPSCTFFYFLVLSCTFLLAGFLLFFRLGDTSLVNWDEAWLASVSQDIATRDDWLGGQWNGQTWFYEPPLATWALAILYKIFGPSEFWLRSFNAFLGLLIIIVVYKLSILIAKSAASAFISVIILLSDIEFLFRGRQINVEIPVTFFLLLTIFYLLKAFQKNTIWVAKRLSKLANLRVRLLPSEATPSTICNVRVGDGERANFANEIAIAISMGLAFLTKRASPILILPAIIVAVIPAKAGIYLDRFRGKPGMTKNILLMLLVFFAVAAPWYLINYWRWGNQFTNEFFFGYTLGKIRSVNPGAGADIFFYVTALRHAFKFFFPLIPFAIIWASVKSFRDKKIAALTIYILTFLTFLTAAPIKSSWFLLPIHPAIAIVLGLFISELVKFAKLHNRVRSFANFSTVSIILAMIITAWQLWSYRHDFIVPDTTEHQAALAKLAGQLTPPENPIYLDDDYLPVAVFYSRRRVIPLRFNRLQPITPLPIPSGSYILTNSETLPTLQNNYPNTLLVKETADLILIQNK